MKKYSFNLRSLLVYSIGITSLIGRDGAAIEVPSFFIFSPTLGAAFEEEGCYPINGDSETGQNVPPTSIPEETYPVSGDQNEDNGLPFLPQKKKPEPERPSVFVCLKENPGFFFTAEYLLWSFRQDDLAYAFVANPSFAETSTPQKFTEKDQNFGWNSGFRLGAGGRLPYDNWDLYLNWTYFHFLDESSVSKIDAIVPVDAFAPVGLTAYASSAQAFWHVNFQTLDLELGKSYRVSKFVNFRPFIGIEGALIYQTQRVFYSDIVTSDPSLVANYIKRRNDVLAIGPRIGVNSRWLVGAGIGVVANISSALLFSNFDLKTTLSNSETNLEITSHTNYLRPNVQMALGIDWSYCFNNKFVLRLGANYETQLWWNQWMSSLGNVNGDLGTQGLTLQSRVDF